MLVTSNQQALQLVEVEDVPYLLRRKGFAYAPHRFEPRLKCLG